MKRKIFFLMFMLFSLCGAFGGYTFSVANAASVSADVWTGEYNAASKQYVLSDVADWDFYQDGTNFYINSAVGMAYFANTVNGGTTYYGSSIYLETDLNWNDQPWISIGNESNTFSGNFDGQGHFIYGANVVANDGDAGIFGCTSSAMTIKDLHVKGITFGDATNIGGLLGRTYSESSQMTISGCSIENIKIDGLATNVGGIVGEGLNVVIDNCQSDVDITLNGGSVLGGLVGHGAVVSILKSSVLGSLTVASGKVGGLVGEIISARLSAIENCYNMASIANNASSAAGFGGGLVGRTAGQLSINNCYNAGSIDYGESSGNYYAGLVGSGENSQISNSFVLAYPTESTELSASVSFIANGNKTLNNVYYPQQGNANTQNTVKNLANLAKTADFYKNTAYFAANSWDFNNIWKISATVNGGLPYIDIAKTNNDQNVEDLVGDGSLQSPYQIKSAGDLAKLAFMDVTQKAYYVLQNDIDLTGKTLVPIGLSGAFNGVFDGNGHTISGITCSYHEQFGHVGLFAQTNNAVIKNLTVANFKLLTGTSSNVGTLIGSATNTYIINCKDNSGLAEKTVGSFVNLTVAYGKNNLNARGLDTTTLNLSGGHTTAYDIAISGEGGNFYKKSTTDKALGELYFGEYHILLKADDGTVLNQGIDETFGAGNSVTTLSGTSANLSGGDVLIKRGSKQRGFLFADGTAVGNGTLTQAELEKAIFGLKASWEEKTVAIKVVYNAYELAKFGQASGDVVYGDYVVDDKTYAIEQSGGQVYINFVVPYDSVWGEYSALEDVPTYLLDGETAILRGGKFEIEGLYTSCLDGVFGDKFEIENNNSFINDSYTNNTLYAKWQGKNETAGQINIKINYNGNIIDETSADWDKIVAGTALGGSENVIISSKSDNYTFDTLESFVENLLPTMVDSASADNSHFVKLSFCDGYQFKGNTIDIAYTVPDPNFGKLRGAREAEDVSGNVITDANGNVKILKADNGAVGFKNLADDITITYYVEMATYTDTFVGQGEFNLGLGARKNFVVTKNEGGIYQSNYVVQKVKAGGSDWLDLLVAMQMLNEDGTAKEEFSGILQNWADNKNLFVGFDLKNNKIVFSSGNYGANADGQSYVFDTWKNPNEQIDSVKFLMFGVKEQIGEEIITDYFAVVEDKSVYVDRTDANKPYEYNSYVLCNPNSSTINYPDVAATEIVRYSYGNDQYEDYINEAINFISYDAFKSFVLIASTESEDATFGECQYSATFSKGYDWKPHDSNGAKYLFDFNEVTKPGYTFKEDEALSAKEDKLTIISNYTTAYFALDYVYCDKNGNESADIPANFAANKPVAKFEGANVIHVDQQNQVINFTVESTDFYKLLGNTDNILNNFKIVVTGYNQKDADDKGLNILSDGTLISNVFLESMTIYNKGCYIGSSLEKYQTLTYKITLGINANTLINGKYTIMLKCVDMPYTLNASAGVVNYAAIRGKTDAEIAAGIIASNGAANKIAVTPSFDEFDKEHENTITVDAHLLDGTAIAKETQLKYDDQIALRSESTNGGYVLLGWYLQAENASKFVRLTELDGAISEFYIKNADLENVENKERFDGNLVVQAIYVRKQVAFTFNNKYTLQDVKTAENKTLSTSWQVDFDMSLAGDANSSTNLTGKNYTYNYYLSNAPTNLVLSLAGSDAAGYYFAGYQLMRFVGGDYQLVGQQEISFKENADDVVSAQNGTITLDMRWLQQQLASTEPTTLMHSTSFEQLYIQPIIKQKTATIYFHSGTGDTNNLYGDNFNGEVQNFAGEDVSKTQYILDGMIFGQNILFKDVTLQDDTSLVIDTNTSGVKLNQLFARRTGYQYTGNWMRGASFVGSNNITLYATYFDRSAENLDLHLHLAWTANVYDIVYDKNDDALYGTATGSTPNSGAIYYDGVATLAQSSFTITGYQFLGWSSNKDASTAQYAGGQTLDRTQVNALIGDLTNNATIRLYAVWQAISYKIEINYAGGTFDGQPTEIFSLDYNQAFSFMTKLDGTDCGLDEVVAKREGFSLLGFYVVSGQLRQNVTSDTHLNTALLATQFENETQKAVTLYANWEYSANASFSLTTTELSSTYNGQNQAVSVAKYFKDGYISNYIIADNFDLSPLSTSLQDVDVSASLAKVTEGVEISGNIFTVKNAGVYNLSLIITLADANEFSNLGTLQTINVGLTYVVEQAALEPNWDENLAAFNAKRLMQPFVRGTESISNLTDLAYFVRNMESISASVSNKQLCDYVTTKYYLMLSTNNGQLYNTYKQWNYDSYIGYVQENEIESAQILENAKRFAFYNFNSTNDEIAFYNTYLSLQNTEVFGVNNDIKIETVKVVSDTGSMQAGNTYSLRAYLQTADTLANYLLSYDGKLRQYYLNIGTAYIMPKPIVVGNLTETKATFFSPLYSQRNVQWSLGEYAWQDMDYFELPDVTIGGLPVYVRASLYTSCSGSADQDVSFSFKNDVNYLYFDNASFILNLSDFYLDYTANFKLILDDSFVFTILKTADVLQLDVTAKYLTINGYTQYLDKIDQNNINLADINELPTSLLSISRITYTLNGANPETVAVDKNQLFVDGILIYEIQANNANFVSVMLNSAVTKVEFNANQIKIGDFIYLYKWIEGNYEAYGVEDDTVGTGVYAYEINKTDTEEQHSKVQLSAIFTDLVRVNFNLNFPSSFAADNYTFLRLGKTTALNFAYPDVEGFTLASLIQSGGSIDLSTNAGKEAFFNGVAGTYVGLDANAPRKTITFNALWNVAQITGTPLMSEYVTAVSSFAYLNAGDVAYLNNINQDVFDYTYAWLKWNGSQFVLVSNQEVFTLANGGSIEDDGLYQLQLIANLKPEFLSCLADRSVTSSSFNVNFNITFKLNLLTDIEMPQNTSATYDSLSHLTDWNINITYAQWDRLLQNEDGTTGGYGQPNTGMFAYSADDDVYFELYLNGDQTTGTKVADMVDAGTYTVYIRFKDGKFDTTAYNGPLSFTFVINPYELDIKNINFDDSKPFNTQDPEFIKEITVGLEKIEILFQRNDKLEDVGQYYLYLSQGQNSNYKFMYGDVVLFENAALTEAGKTTSIGKFVIEKTGTLRLDFGQKLQAVYAEEGYTAQISSDFHLLIKNGGRIVEDVELTLFDNAAGLEISSEIANILKPHVDDIFVKFANPQSVDIATDAMQYNLVATLGSQFAKYFASVEFASTSVFEITPYQIDISALNFNKTYDGQDTKKIKLDGYNMYVVAKYNNGGHAGTNIALTLSLQGAEGTSANTANFTLKSATAFANIDKLDATMNLPLKTDTLSYGDVTKDNIRSLVDFEARSVVAGTGENQKDVTSLLMAEYYSLVFNLNTNKTNAAGFVFAGTYTVDMSESAFNDFNMTILPVTFTVLPVEIVAPITANYITVSTEEEIKPEYEMQLPQLVTTKDQLSYKLTVINDGAPVVGGKLAAGTYQLAGVGAVDGKVRLNIPDKDSLGNLKDDLGSVIVVIQPNAGFTVVSSAQTLYATFADESILTQDYDGTEFTFGYNTLTNKFTFNGNEIVVNFYKDITDTTSVVEGLSFSEFVIYNGVETNTTFKNAGTYLLSAKAVCTDATYSNIILNANFVINKIVINVNDLVITKVYDGTNTKDFEVLGKVEEDDVYIRATFNFADVDKATSAELVLGGKDAANYVLSQAEPKAASITPASGTLKLSKNNFTYGQISKDNNFIADFVQAEDANGNAISPMQYADGVRISISNATYSPMQYLVTNTYSISVSATSANYTFETITANITVEKYKLEITFTQSGQISVPFGTTLNGNKVDFSFATPLFENASFTLVRNSTSTSIGVYKIVDGQYVSADENYVATVVDQSAGAFEIVKAVDMLYVLFAEGENVDNSYAVAKFYSTYNANTYNSVRIENIAGKWHLVVYNSANNAIMQTFALAFYTLESDGYVLFNGQVDGLSVADIKFVNNRTAKDVGEYNINASGATSASYDIKIGKRGAQYAFCMSIQPKEITFKAGAEVVDEGGKPVLKNGLFTRTFNNSLAIYNFAADQILDGIVSGEKLFAEITLKNGSDIGFYTGSYSVSARLYDDGTFNANNYIFKTTTLAGSEYYITSAGDRVVGEITFAPIVVKLDNQTFGYGEIGIAGGILDLSMLLSKVSFVTDFDFDLKTYNRTFDWYLTIKDAQYSAADKLKVGTYLLALTFNSADFIVGGYLINNVSQKELTATLKIDPKAIVVKALNGGESLQSIFTKVYDGTADANIYSGSALRFGFDGAYLQDNVQVVSAQYSDVVGTSLDVNFVLDEINGVNYVVEPYRNGVITRREILLTFDYDHGSISTDLQGEELEKLAYPFVNAVSVSANGDGEFPATLNRAGYTFTGWTLNFAGLTQNQRTYLEKLKTSLGFTSFEEFGIYKISVADNATTVALLDALLSDSEDTFNKYYFAYHNQVEFVFAPNFDIMQQSLEIQVTDKAGKISKLGNIEVWVGANESSLSKIATVNGERLYVGNFDYNSFISLKISANEHSFIDTIYQNSMANAAVADDYVVWNFNLDGDYQISVAFDVQQINVIVDLSGIDDARFDDSRFTASANNKYTWQTNFNALDGISLFDINKISRFGYDIQSLLINESQIAADDFADITLQNFVTDTAQKNFDIIISATADSFAAKDVEITLELGYNNLTMQLTAKFGQTYSAVLGQEPLRAGFEFKGWSYNGQLVDVAQQIDFIEARTLQAVWKQQQYSLTLTAAHAAVEGAFIKQEDGSFIANNLTYGSTLNFKITPNMGYEISTQSETWQSQFQVTFADGVANVVYNVPAEDISFVVPVLPKINTVTITGNHLGELSAFNETANLALSIVNDQVQIETDDVLKITATAADGYDILDNISILQAGITYTASVQDGQLNAQIFAINQNVTITLNTQAKDNTITLEFVDENGNDFAEAIGHVVINNTSISVENLPELSAKTDTDFSFGVVFKYGYKFVDATSDAFTISSTLQNNVINITLHDVKTEGTVQIVGTKQKYTIQTRALSFDDHNQPDMAAANTVLVNGSRLPTNGAQFEFGSVLSISNVAYGAYIFAGWSYDGTNIVSREKEISYTVTENATIYAHFSAGTVVANLGGLDYAQAYVDGILKDIFTEINTLEYYNTNGIEIQQIQIHYGTTADVRIKIPTGYGYYGFGYYDVVDKEYKIFEDKRQGVENEFGDVFVNAQIYSSAIANVVADKIFFVITSYSAEASLTTQIDVDGTILPDTNIAGKIELCDISGNMADLQVHDVMYLNGTRVHYKNRNKTAIISYTNEDFYIKVSANAGFLLGQTEVFGKDAQLKLISTNGQYQIYQVCGIVGGQNLAIQANFKPVLNDVKILFTSTGQSVYGGAFEIADNNPLKQVWISGQSYDSVSVAAYTGSSFVVKAYVGAGYKLQGAEILGGDGIVKSVQMQSLLTENTGFNGKITFRLENIYSSCQIKIKLVPCTYTVVLKDGKQVLAKIKNVQFGTNIDLSYQNHENIEIIDSRLNFVANKLNLVLRKDGHNFEGYFSQQNGAGAMYINYNSEVVSAWKETGYTYNSVSGKYELSPNCVAEDGKDIEISLYLYQSYLKTRLQFEILPKIYNLTAKQMIKGVDDTNSWFYSASPNYIEVAFNTNISITAPEVEGYKFYKFKISQQLADGTWLADVTSYFDAVPWSTNEYDKVVQVLVQVIYFAEVDVKVEGGQGRFAITQAIPADAQTQMMWDLGYVDTSVDFYITAVPAAGYTFDHWTLVETNSIRYSETLQLFTTQKMQIKMTVVGKKVGLDFSAYDTTYGYIGRMDIKNPDGVILPTVILAAAQSNGVVKLEESVDVKVGDQITFVVDVNEGFAVVWNRDDINFEKYQDEKAYFSFVVPAECADTEIAIIPTFTDQQLSISVTTSLEEIDNALDVNNVDAAGYLAYNGKKVTQFAAPHGQDIVVQMVTSDRYAAKSIIIITMQNTFTNMQDFVIDGNIVLTDAFITQNNIVGNISINIEYVRMMWQDDSSQNFEGLGTRKNPYHIKSVQDLVLMMKLCNDGKFNENGSMYKDSVYVLDGDLDLSEKFWTPIGTQEVPFAGTFDFNGHTISSIYTATIYHTLEYGGLFGVLGTNATIILNHVSYWWIWLLIAIIIILIVLIVVVVIVAYNRKKRREQMAKH